MSSSSIQLLLPALSPPARWLRTAAAGLRSELRSTGRAVWLALEAHGERRSRRELLALADHWRDINPTLARELRSYVRGGPTEQGVPTL
jgi:hypothetical protein